MSRVWERCPVETVCGKCAKPILVGQPQQLITPHPEHSLKRRRPFVRCEWCASETPPDDLPPPVKAEAARALAGGGGR